MPKFKSISEQGGLKEYLNLPEQQEKHGGNGWDKWHEYHHILKLNKSQLAEAFKVSRETIRKWIELDT